MHIPESQNEKDARVENLWRHLDPKETGEIDLKGLRQGLKTLNHRSYLRPDDMRAVLIRRSIEGCGGLTAPSLEGC